MNWLFISPEFPPSTKTGAIRPSKFARYFHELGENVTVLTYNEDGIYESKLHEDIKILRVKKKKIPYINDNGINFTVFNFLFFLNLIRKNKFEKIFISVPVFMPMILVFLAKRLYNIDYYLDYRDLWAADPYLAVSRKDKLLRKIATIIEPSVMADAKLVTFVSEAMMKDQLKFYPNCKGNFHVISTGFDENDMHFSPEDLKLGCGKYSKYISHVGMLEYNMNIDDFLKIISNENVQNLLKLKGLKFLFVGAKIKTIIDVIPQDLLIEYCDVIGSVSRKEALIINKCSYMNLILGSNSPQRLNRKVFEVIRLAKRVFYIGNDISPTANIIKQCDAGIIVNGGCEKLVSKFIACISDKEKENISHEIFAYNKIDLISKYLKLVKDE